MTEAEQFAICDQYEGFSGAVVVEPGHGKHVTFREFLGEGFFDEIKRLRDAGAERIVFWFDC